MEGKDVLGENYIGYGRPGLGLMLADSGKVLGMN